MNSEQLTALAKASVVPVLIGLAAWKFGKGNLIKAMGAGVLGVQAATVIRSVTGL